MLEVSFWLCTGSMSDGARACILNWQAQRALLCTRLHCDGPRGIRASNERTPRPSVASSAAATAQINKRLILLRVLNVQKVRSFNYNFLEN